MEGEIGGPGTMMGSGLMMDGDGWQVLSAASREAGEVRGKQEQWGR